MADAPAIVRFESFVEQITVTSCWIWLGAVTGSGYGAFHYRGRQLRAHRAAYEFFRGPIPAGLDVCHRCDVRVCVNPDHLWLGTDFDNQQDASRKGRLAFGDRNWTRRHPERLTRGDQHHARLHPERLARGERVALAKLTASTVRQARDMRAAGLPVHEIARQLSVTPATVSKVTLRRTWRHVS